MFTRSFRGRFFDIYRSDAGSDVQIIHYPNEAERPFALERVTRTERGSSTSTLKEFDTLEGAITFAQLLNV